MPQLVFGDQSTTRRGSSRLPTHGSWEPNSGHQAWQRLYLLSHLSCETSGLCGTVVIWTNSEACVCPASTPPTSTPLAPKHIFVYFSIDEWFYRTLPTYEFLLFSMSLLLPTSHDYTNYIPFGYFILTQRTLWRPFLLVKKFQHTKSIN